MGGLLREILRVQYVTRIQRLKSQSLDLRRATWVIVGSYLRGIYGEKKKSL
jgi:hypothetical protein